MGAVVVDGSISAATWKNAKPKDYTGGTLDSALAAYEKLKAKKTATITLPTMPKESAKAYEDCIKELETAVKDMKSTASHYKDLAKSLDAVKTAAKSTEKELQKLCDGTNDKDKRKAYLNGASTASAIALKAGESASQIK